MNAQEFLKENNHKKDGYSSQEYIADMMERYHDYKVKTCNKPQVSKCRCCELGPLLLAYHNYFRSESVLDYNSNPMYYINNFLSKQ